MKLPFRNPWERIFVSDPMGPNTLPIYDTSEFTVPRVVYSFDTRKAERRVFGDRVNVPVKKITSYAELNNCGIATILEGAKVSNFRASSFKEAQDRFLSPHELTIATIVASDKISKDLRFSFMCKISGELNSDYWMSGKGIYFLPKIKEEVAYIFPDPEYLGAIPIMDIPNSEEKKYGFGLIYPDKIAKIRLNGYF